MSKLALLLFGFSLSLIIAEGALRLYGFGRPLIYVSDETKLWGLAADVNAYAPSYGVEYRINARGYRDDEVLEEKPADAFRVLALGDSVLFGQGVSFAETMTEQIQSALSDVLAGRTVEVINTAVAGYNVYQYDVISAGEGAALSPDLILIGLCKNDFVGPSDIEILRRLAQEKLDYRSDVHVRLRRMSAIFHLVDGMAMRFSAWLGNPVPEALRYESKERGEPQRRYTLATLEGIARRARRNGTPLLVAAFPTRKELLARRVEVPVDSLARAVQAEGQHFIDLFDVFVEAAGRGEILFLDPVHPTREGHSVAALAVMEQLVSLGLTDPGPRP
jgi:lysophospholipase L1-like esterase